MIIPGIFLTNVCIVAAYCDSQLSIFRQCQLPGLLEIIACEICSYYIIFQGISVFIGIITFECHVIILKGKGPILIGVKSFRVC